MSCGMLLKTAKLPKTKRYSIKRCREQGSQLQSSCPIIFAHPKSSLSSCHGSDVFLTRRERRGRSFSTNHPTLRASHHRFGLRPSEARLPRAPRHGLRVADTFPKDLSNNVLLSCRSEPWSCNRIPEIWLSIRLLGPKYSKIV